MANRRQTLRELGIQIGKFKAGERNSITDVPGVKVGHKTLTYDLSDGRAIRTGVTAILPHSGNLFQEKIIGSSYVINGFGKTIGFVQLQELGMIESPIMLTNTLSVPAVAEGTIQFLLKENQDIGNSTGTVNVIVGECNDGYLNDIRGLHVKGEHAIDAIKTASIQVEQGCVGAGTGMSCLGFKGGVGTSSRKLIVDGHHYTLGALVVSNFGTKDDLPSRFNNSIAIEEELEDMPDGSIMIVLATDAPLSERQLHRLAKRASFGLARTGSYAAHGSGDIVIAFSTAHKISHYPTGITNSFSFIVEDGPLISNFFQMAVEVVEESIWNSLCTATTTIGQNQHIRYEFDYNFFR